MFHLVKRRRGDGVPQTGAGRSRLKRIESLRRGLSVMDLLQGSGPLSLAELARQSGLAKATLLRILLTLEEAGHARRGLADGLWHPGAQGVHGPAPERRLAQISGPPLDRLCQKVLWPSDVGVYDTRTIRVLETSRRMSPFLVNRVVNYGIHVLPSAMGRAILAWSPEAEREAILDDLRKSDEPHDRLAAHPDKVAQLIEETRARGYATRHPGYFVNVRREALVSAIAVPVLSQGGVIAAVNLSWLTSAATEADLVATALGPLTAAAREIEEGLAAAQA